MKEFLISASVAEFAIRNRHAVVQLYTKSFDKVYFVLYRDLVMHGLFSHLRNFRAYCTEENAYIHALLERGTFTLGYYSKKVHPNVTLMNEADEQFIELIDPNFRYSEEESNHAVGGTQNKKNAYGVEHVPVGSFVTRAPILGDIQEDCTFPEVYQIRKVVRNGVNGFALCTTARRHSSLVWDIGATEDFKVTRVTRVIERGVPHDPLNGHEKNSFPKLKNGMDYYIRGKFPEHDKNKHWLCYNFVDLVCAIAQEIKPSERAVLDTETLAKRLKEMSFVKRSDKDSWHSWQVYLVNKKRAKRYVRQNFNRFLSSARKEQERIDRVDVLGLWHYGGFRLGAPVSETVMVSSKKPAEEVMTTMTERQAQFMKKWAANSRQAEPPLYVHESVKGGVFDKPDDANSEHSQFD